MKKALLHTMLCLTLILCLSSCWYSPPEGWTKQHHTYEEVLEFAESIDTHASVTEKYTDSVDEYDWKYREWDAVIKGVDCHIASVSDWVWNDGIGAGEFAKTYYRIDTDCDSIIMQRILSEKYPEWQTAMDLRSRYDSYDTVFVELNLPEFRKLDDEEIERVWQTALLINEEYNTLSIGRKTVFCVPSPGVYWNPKGEGYYYVGKDSHVCFEDYSEMGKRVFLQEYQEAWDLLQSGMPVYDD